MAQALVFVPLARPSMRTIISHSAGLEGRMCRWARTACLGARLGRRDVLPRCSKRHICIGGAGVYACDPR